MKSDIEIAQEAQMVHIREVAAKLDFPEDDLELYGKYKAACCTRSIWTRA